ncbi:MAG: fused MFS/spermidine synthase [Verrucomicrobiota bacterium]
MASGACGLACQMVWSRQFALGLGHELPSVLAVLAALFGGLALGAWILDERIQRSPIPGQWYGGLEIIIGVWSLCLAPLIPWANEIVLSWIGLEASFARHWLIAFGLPFLLLLPATFAMGATFPAMERFIAPCFEREHCIGALYAANTFGAVVGVLAATFWVMPALGFRQTMIAVALLNIACGLAALALQRKYRPPSENHFSDKRVESSAVAPSKRWFITILFTGLLGIGYEVLGIRVLAQVFENTIYSYASALIVFLLATAIGAALYQRLLRTVSAENLLSLLLACTAFACIAGGWALLKAPPIYAALRRTLPSSLLASIAVELAIAAAIFAVPALLMGAMLSLLLQKIRQTHGRIGRALGLNTIGSALAPAVAGLILLPNLGAKWTLVLIAAGYVALFPSVRPWPIGIAVAAAAGVILFPSHLRLVEAPPRGQILAFKEGVMESVAVVRHFDANRSLLVNNRFVMGGTGAAGAARRHAHLPLLLHKDPRRALFLGMGTGISLGGSATHPELLAEGVELVPEVVEVTNYFSPENRLPNPKIQIHVADARRFIRRTPHRYDVIVADLFHPARDGAGTLYTVEHFRAFKDRLEAGGVVCQWLPLYQLDEAMVRVIVRTFLEVFPQTRAFLLRWNVDTPVLGLIALEPTSKFPADWLAQRVQSETLEQDLKSVTLADPWHLFGTYLGGPEALSGFSAGVPLNTDDWPIVMFRAPDFVYGPAASSYGRLITLLEALRPRDATELIDTRSASGKEFATSLERFLTARDIYLRGLVAETEGRQEQAISLFLESAKASAEFSTAYAHCLTLAMQQAKPAPQKARALLEALVKAQPQRPVARELLDRLDAPDPQRR